MTSTRALAKSKPASSASASNFAIFLSYLKMPPLGGIFIWGAPSMGAFLRVRVPS